MGILELTTRLTLGGNNTMERKQLFLLDSALNKINEWPATTVLSPQFSYVVSKNKKLIAPFMKTIRDSEPKPFKEYEEEVQACMINHAEKDQLGNIVWEVQGKVIKYTDKEAAEEAIARIDTKYEEGLALYKVVLNDFATFMESEIELELFKIDLDLMPSMPHQNFMDIFLETGMINEPN